MDLGPNSSLIWGHSDFVCPLKFHSDDPQQDQVFPFPGANWQMAADTSEICAETIQSTVDPEPHGLNYTGSLMCGFFTVLYCKCVFLLYDFHNFFFSLAHFNVRMQYIILI